MKPARIAALPPLILLILAAAIALPDEAAARPARLAFVDDDWEPSEGKSGPPRYETDPGYEIYVREALDLTGLDYDEFEIWPAGATAPERPTLAELSGYPLLIWSCAANDSAVLQVEELALLRDYMDLGGKVLLSGQGILDDLERHLGEPPYDAFLTEILGIELFFLNYQATELQAVPAGYFAGLADVVPQYSTLPDPEPDRVDPFYVLPGMDSHLQGLFPAHPDLLLPVSSNRFKWRPLHFQSFMFAAIADASQRADWLLAAARWLGLEGDSLYDFMIGYEDFEPVIVTPPHFVALSAEFYHLDFHADGSQPGETRLAKDLLPLGGDWEIGETFLVEEAGQDSEVDVLLLEGPRGARVSLRSSDTGPDAFQLVWRLSENGVPVFEDGVDGLDAEQFHRLLLSYSGDTGGELQLRLTDALGVPIWSSATLFDPLFDRCALRAFGEGTPGALPISGWVDDLFFAGSLSHEGGTPVLVGFFDLEPVEGGVDLRWEAEGIPGLRFRLSRDGEPVAFDDLGGHYLARDRAGVLAGGGFFTYNLHGKAEAGEWNLLFEESLRLPGTGQPPLRLLGAAPNPFNPSTEIRYELDLAAELRLEIYDLSGRRVRTLLAGRLPAGPGSVAWDGRDGDGRALAGGLYLLELTGPGVRQSGKLVLLK